MDKKEAIEKVKTMTVETFFSGTLFVKQQEVIAIIEQIGEPTSGCAEEAPRYLRNVLARLRGLPEHDREVWLKGIMDEFELDFSHAKWREGYEQGKFDGAVEAEKPNKVVLTKEEADYLDTFGLSNKHEVCKAIYFISRSGWGYSLQNGYGDRDEGLLEKITHDEDDENSTRTKLIKAVLFGYDVEQEKRYVVTDGNHLYLKEYKDVGIIAISNKISESTRYIKKFENKDEAQKIADVLKWKVQEVE